LVEAALACADGMEGAKGAIAAKEYQGGCCGDKVPPGLEPRESADLEPHTPINTL